MKWFEPIKPREIPEEDLRKEDEVEWMLMGPFPNPEDDLLTEDQYPPEREINPDAEYTLDNRTLKWIKVRPVDGVFDLRLMFETDWGIAYLYNRVQCEEDGRAQIIVGTSGGCRIWVNDELVFSQHKRHSDFNPGKFRAILNLKQGWNKLLIKVEGAWGHWKASCRLAHQDGHTWTLNKLVA